MFYKLFEIKKIKMFEYNKWVYQNLQNLKYNKLPTLSTYFRFLLLSLLANTVTEISQITVTAKSPSTQLVQISVTVTNLDFT